MVNRDKILCAIPHIPITIEEYHLETGALKILEVIRTHWNRENICFKLLTDGLSNKLLKCNLQDANEENSLLIRVYGHKTDLFIDRKAETQNIKLLNKVGLAPQLYATFENGLAYEFVPGCTLNVKTVRCPSIYQLVAKQLARFHRVKLPNTPAKSVLWEKLENYFNLLPERFSDDFKEKRFKLLNISKQDIYKEITFLKERLVELGSPVVFAHNDVLLGNVIYSEKNNAVTLIDYEYAGPNYQAYDIANHFAEFAGLADVDYSYYPNKEFQMNWLGIYLAAYHDCDDISENDIHKLYVNVNQFVLAAHIFWGLWALIQAEHSAIDFDYMSYANIRFNEYFLKKEALLALNLS